MSNHGTDMTENNSGIITIERMNSYHAKQDNANKNKGQHRGGGHQVAPGGCHQHKVVDHTRDDHVEDHVPALEAETNTAG